MVHEDRFKEQDAREAALVEEFLVQYPPNHDLWEGGWLKLFHEGADSPELQGAYRRLLLHAAIAVRAAGGPVRDNHIAEAVESLSRDD